VAAKFKMATKTKFAYVAKKTLVSLRTFGQFDYFYRFWAGKNKKNKIPNFYRIFFSQKFKMAPIFNMVFFLATFSRNIKMQKFCIFFKKKLKKIRQEF
jgi:hypothetical protein